MAKKQESHTNGQDDTAVRAWMSVVRAYNQCSTVMASKLGAIGFTTAQYEVVTRLNRQPGQTQQQLARRCFVAKSGISMLINRMEAEGWVLRSADAQDARVKRLTLTALGQQQAEGMLRVQSEIVGAMAAPLTPSQLRQLTGMMTAMSVSLVAVSQADDRQLGD